ncbi:hypothetical protein EVAR_32579_1 [Eumeta japonica]|uniref:Uncharacterized protein n=1 Tax=Eumeta variegata TaxID=151549 RepID=A0A4C1VPQ6_EUMVA|nr:hypothetical protein EVAR_32579_1 [Eumeta japonica]
MFGGEVRPVSRPAPGRGRGVLASPLYFSFNKAQRIAASRAFFVVSLPRYNTLPQTFYATMKSPLGPVALFTSPVKSNITIREQGRGGARPLSPRGDGPFAVFATRKYWEII